jgi:hypothetical protein
LKYQNLEYLKKEKEKEEKNGEEWETDTIKIYFG